MLNSAAAHVPRPASSTPPQKTFCGPTFLYLLPRKREAVRQFTPSWYTVTMGLGSVAITIGTFPYHFRGQNEIGWAVWWMTVGLFILFSCLMMGRVLFYSSTMPKLFRHTKQSLFLGAIPMSCSTLTNGIILYWYPRFGSNAAAAAHVIFWINLPAVLGCILLVPLSMFTVHRHGLHSMSAVWLLPVVPACVAANTAGVIADKMSHPGQAVAVIYTGLCLLGIGFLLSYQICSIYYSRLTFHSLPAKEVIVSSFLPVGPMAMTAWATLNLATAAASQLGKYAVSEIDSTVDVTWLEQQVFPVMVASAGAVAMFLWGFATWWLLLAVCSISATIRHGIPFNLGWWGSVFPLGVFTGSTIMLGQVVHSKVFTVLGAVAVGVHVVVAVLVSYLTLQKAWSGHLFHAPCLTPSASTLKAAQHATVATGIAGGNDSTAAGSVFNDVTDAALKLEQQLSRDISADVGNQRFVDPSQSRANCYQTEAEAAADVEVEKSLELMVATKDSQSSNIGDVEEGSTPQYVQHVAQPPVQWQNEVGLIK